MDQIPKYKLKKKIFKTLRIGQVYIFMTLD